MTKPEPTTHVDVAIVGAGIGGLSAAVALRQAGINAEVFERAPRLGEVGAAIVVRVQSLELLTRWGVADALAGHAVRVNVMEDLSADGTLLATGPMRGEPGDPDWADSVHRADLYQVLLEQLPPETLHLGRTCAGVHDHGTHADIGFTDGSRVRARLVIGADGIRSTVRDLFSTDTPVFSGMTNCRGVVPADLLPAHLPNDRIRSWMGPDRGVVTLPIRGGAQLGFDAVLFTPVTGQESWSNEIDAEQVAARYTGFDPLIATMINSSMVPITEFSTYDREPLSRWSSDRITLLGDAAHPMLPYKGQGANQAIQDAGALADLLAASDDADIPAALKAYGQLRAPITAALQSLSRTLPEPAELNEPGR